MNTNMARQLPNVKFRRALRLRRDATPDLCGALPSPILAAGGSVVLTNPANPKSVRTTCRGPVSGSLRKFDSLDLIAVSRTAFDDTRVIHTPGNWVRVRISRYPRHCVTNA